ncbi:unnamed protein product [Amoebophrya sp. A120]|nr:unnamed protein product [Amoebophrya sp. A120]|eukprot:GSA120T00009677001.1
MLFYEVGVVEDFTVAHPAALKNRNDVETGREEGTIATYAVTAPAATERQPTGRASGVRSWIDFTSGSRSAAGRPLGASGSLPLAEQLGAHPVPEYKKKICKHFAKAGFCRYEEACKFLHVFPKSETGADCESGVKKTGGTDNDDPPTLERTIEAEQAQPQATGAEEPQQRRRRPCGRLVTRNAGKHFLLRQFIHEKLLASRLPNGVDDLDNQEKSTNTPKNPQEPEDAHGTSTRRSASSGLQVLDVAGGKGELAFELLLCSKNVEKVCIVDPRPLDLRKCERRFALDFYSRSARVWDHVDETKVGMYFALEQDHAESSSGSALNKRTVTTSQTATKYEEAHERTPGAVRQERNALVFKQLQGRLEQSRVPLLLRKELFPPGHRTTGTSATGDHSRHQTGCELQPRDLQAFEENLRLSVAWDWKRHDREHEASEKESAGHKPPEAIVENETKNDRHGVLVLQHGGPRTKPGFSLQPYCIPVSEVEVDGDDAQFYFPTRTTTATVARTAAEEHQPREATVLGSSVLSEALDHYQEIIAKTDFIVAMHPDQAAEAVVDLALHLDVPFFLVPCCVYAKEFPKRHIRVPRRRPDTIRSGSDKAASAGAEPVPSTSSVEGDKEKHVLKQVKSYEDLLQYLQNKDPGIQRSELIGIEGKNVVLWKV